MKKLLYMMLACVICCALVFSGCANNSSGTSGEAAEEAAEEETAEPDLSELIIGTWEGHCTSEGSEFDDGQDHRWEYKADGTYVYYVKDGDNWVASDDLFNQYSVDGNILSTRWGEDDTENSEAWEISIDGDTMNWTADRQKDDGSIFTVTFEMTRVKE